MNDTDVMAKWNNQGGLVVTEDQLVAVLTILASNGIKDFMVSYLGGQGWGIGRVY